MLTYWRLRRVEGDFTIPMVNANSGDKDIIKEMIKDINLLNQ
jgi:hypothetical protein